MKETNLEGNLVPLNFYEAKKLVPKLNLRQQQKNKKFDCCITGCMMYYKGDENVRSCKFCDALNTRNLKREMEDIKMWLLRYCTSYHSYHGFNTYMLLQDQLNI